ncbi:MULTISPECIES: hypothetical protein [unclassified Paraburkholderia]|uniref:hypothetical protein n=1 Tax=unclassified Paraburkholderia TaxID=2615204 RepID=UPI00161AAAB3|nr:MULTISPECIES: hypothetical protein [unclassified Paraburkholderia]MBB5447112.1 hypothetical protein [Paraburkholderia sp. WSM4177]MBB5487653.1 hypothetical protein [Paraburkholderia sp. WSM4180]
MKPIRYEVLYEGGPVMILGEAVEIENDLGLTFGVHCNGWLPREHDHRWIVTHTASGLMTGWGATRAGAVLCAAERVRSATAGGYLAASIERAMRTRAVAISAVAAIGKARNQSQIRAP